MRRVVEAGGAQGVWAEFKAFALGGNMFDLALGFIIGTAFAALVDSLAGDVIMPRRGGAAGGRASPGRSLARGAHEAAVPNGMFSSLLPVLSAASAGKNASAVLSAASAGKSASAVLSAASAGTSASAVPTPGSVSTCDLS